MNAPFRTYKSAVYTPAADRTDEGRHVCGDVTYVTFEECGHVMLGNPIFTYRPGDKGRCWACAREEAS